MNDKKLVLRKIWELFSYIRRKSNLDRNELFTLPFFVYLYSNNYIPESLLVERNPKEAFLDILQKAKNDDEQKIFNVFIPFIENLSEPSLCAIFQRLSQINFKILKDNLDYIFDEILEWIKPIDREQR